MAKKKRIWAYTGSMIKPIARYFKKIKVVINPHDIKGSSIGEYFNIYKNYSYVNILNKIKISLP